MNTLTKMERCLDRLASSYSWVSVSVCKKCASGVVIRKQVSLVYIVERIGECLDRVIIHGTGWDTEAYLEATNYTLPQIKRLLLKAKYNCEDKLSAPCIGITRAIHLLDYTLDFIAEERLAHGVIIKR
jgi:hypothetical protein